MAPKAMKLMKATKAKGGTKGVAKGGTMKPMKAVGGKGGAKSKDKDKDMGIKVKDMGKKNNEALCSKGNGKGKEEDKGRRKSICVNTLSGQKIAIVVHEFDTIAHVKASLPIVVNAHEFDIMQYVNEWQTISSAKIRNGETGYAVKQGEDARDMFYFSEEEEKNGNPYSHCLIRNFGTLELWGETPLLGNHHYHYYYNDKKNSVSKKKYPCFVVSC